MPYDIKYRDKDGQVKTATVHTVLDTGDGYVRVDRGYDTVVDAHTSTKYIPKEDIVDIRSRETTVAETDFHPPVGDQIRSAVESFNKWRKGQ